MIIITDATSTAQTQVSHLFSPLETISTSLWASLHNHFQYCLFTVMSAVSLYLLISSRLLSLHLRLGRPLVLFPGTIMSILFLERLSSSLLLIYPCRCNRFSLRNADIWHTLTYSCIIWCLTWSFLVLSNVASSFLLHAICSRLAF